MLVEVEEGALLHAAHRPCAALAQVDLIQVELEDLLLRVAELDQHREQRLVELSREGPLPREKDVLRKLLTDRAPPLDDGARAYVPRSRASDPQEIETHVPEKAAVLAGNRGERHVLRDRGERRVGTPLAFLIRELGEEQGIDAKESAGGRFREAVSERGHPAVPDLHQRGRAGLRAVGIDEGAQIDLEDGAALPVLPGCVRLPARAPVPCRIQRLAEVVLVDRHPLPELEPVRVDARWEFPALTGIAEGGKRREPEPVVSEKTENEEEHDQNPAQPAFRK